MTQIHLWIQIKLEGYYSLHMPHDIHRPGEVR